MHELDIRTVVLLPPFVQVFYPILSAPYPIFLEEKNVQALSPHHQSHLQIITRFNPSFLWYIDVTKHEKYASKKQKRVFVSDMKTLNTITTKGTIKELCKINQY